MIKRILLGLCGQNHSDAALRYAIELAETHAAIVTGIAVADIDRLSNVGPVPVGGGAAADDLRQHRIAEARQSIEDTSTTFQNRCTAAGVAHSLHRIEGDPIALVTNYARYHDIVIFGLKSVFHYCDKGDTPYTASELLVPLISGGVRPILAVCEEYRPFRKALIAYSGSMESAKTIRTFVQSRPWPEMQVRIVTVNSDAKKADRLLCEASEYCKLHGFEAETKHLTGNEAQSIEHEAEPGMLM